MERGANYAVKLALKQASTDVRILAITYGRASPNSPPSRPLIRPVVTNKATDREPRSLLLLISWGRELFREEGEAGDATIRPLPTWSEHQGDCRISQVDKP
jgi:hypothetical protein